jgi:hypothetical protein
MSGCKANDCTRRATFDDYCWQHYPVAKKERDESLALERIRRGIEADALAAMLRWPGGDEGLDALEAAAIDVQARHRAYLAKARHRAYLARKAKADKR